MTTKLDRLKEAYFHWLVAQVGKPGHTSRTYWDVLRLMHQYEFIWMVSNDDNRLVDGMELRKRFLQENGTRERYLRDEFGPCSVLEVMIGLSHRLDFLVGGAPEVWAWRLLHNLRLGNSSDPLADRQVSRVVKKLDALVWRNYHQDGMGGFFPLRNPREDQTKVEIWQQMSAYINEMRPGY